MTQHHHTPQAPSRIATLARFATLTLALLALPGWASCALPGAPPRGPGGYHPSGQYATPVSTGGSASRGWRGTPRQPQHVETSAGPQASREPPAAPTGPGAPARGRLSRDSAASTPVAPSRAPSARPLRTRRYHPVTRPPSGAGLVTPPPRERPGLGTTFGERLRSRVRFTTFVRSSAQPAGAVAIHYNDRQGLYAMARTLRRACCTALPVTRLGGGVSVRLVDPAQRPLPGLQVGGRTIIMGRNGQRYAILIQNHTARRYEIVASVDGLDVIDGRRASVGKRGYILPPWGRLLIKGYRTSSFTVAAFRFGSVRGAYATRTTGSSRNVGVVGVAVFTERRPVWSRAEVLRRLRARPFGPSPYAQPPRY